MKMAIRVEGRRRALMTSTFVLLGLMCFTALAGVMLSAGRVSAETATTNTVSIDMLAACSFSAGGGQYSGNVVNGQSSEVTANTIVTSCNDMAGYAIYAIGYSDDTYDSSYHTDMVASLGNSYNIKTNGVNGASYWKMKITNPSNAVVAGSFTSYQQIPSAFTKVASYTSSIASGSITPKYEIFVGSGQVVGTYTGKVKYTLVHPNTMVAGTYTIAYNANGGSGTMTSTTGIYNFEEQTLPTSTFTVPNTGDTFIGWCTTNTAGSYACDGTRYVAGDALPASVVTNGSTVTLYAYYRAPMPYTIAFNANGGSGTMTSITGIYTFEEHILPASTFTAPSGYQFVGWCTTNTAGSYACDGTSYAAGDALPASVVTNGSTVTLYAYYRTPMTFDQAFAAAGKTKSNGYYVMQDVYNTNICGEVGRGQTTTLLDTRGVGTTYTVAKLDDDKCWMTTNLNLAGGTALSADDTDVTSAYIESFSTSNNLTKGDNTIVLPSSSSTSGFDTNNYSYVYNSGNTTNCGASGQNTPCYSYYSWDTATLGSGRSIFTDNTDAPYSICPKGWKLPTSRTTSATNWQTESDFYVLAHQYGLDSTTSTSESDNGFYTQAGPGTIPNFLLAGDYAGDDSGVWFYSGGSSGSYWSATTYFSTTNARSFGFSSSNVNSAGYSSRQLGSSVRCLFVGQ